MAIHMVKGSAPPPPVPYGEAIRPLAHNAIMIQSMLGMNANDDRTAVIVGSGPSLSGFRFEDLAGPQFFTIAINQEAFRNQDKYQANAWLYWDAPVGSERYREDMPDNMDIYTHVSNWQNACVNRASWAGSVRCIHGRRLHPHGWDWAEKNSVVLMGKTSATAAVCVAIKLGFKRILMIGVDMFGSRQSGYYYTGDTKIGTPRKEFDGCNEDQYQVHSNRGMIVDMEVMHKGLMQKSSRWPGKIIQCSPDSPLDCFPRMSWKAAIAS